MKTSPVLIIGLSAFLSACVTVRVAQQPICLPAVSYTAAQEKAFGVALAALSADNPLVVFVTDSIALRQANAAVCGVLTKKGATAP